ncbi:hypothetical protein VMT65_15275 [Nocardia sp. CDC153]|uniref:hypothetical protein n=1 Tax=Nocardia sp. CDC153 TaxID=3112167 RepID=UPI002DBFC8A0|nr:hypothetical protein [Nocardia sp. CDC153]MEC3954401.1 hypothetical protein [Nocardia sp. CDC153]
MQYEIDLAHALQQGQEPSDRQGAEKRLGTFQPHVPTEIIAAYSQVDSVIYGHLEHKGQDQINSAAVGLLLDKLVAWKSSHC